ncbi:MAG: CysZ protein [Myxococcota bacterium]|jgi:CysZ protein
MKGPGMALALKAMLAGLSLSLSDPELRRKLRRGLVLNGLLFVVLIAGIQAGVWWAIGSWLGDGWLGILARVVAVIGVLLAAPVLYALSSSLFMPLVGQRIFEAGRRAAGAPDLPGVGLGRAQSMSIEVRRLLRFVILSALLLLLNLIPGVGSAVYVVLQALLSAWTMGWDLMSYHYERHGLDYGAQRKANASARLGVLTLGGAALLLAMIPVLQLATVTTNLAGAGLLSAWLDGHGD